MINFHRTVTFFHTQTQTVFALDVKLACVRVSLVEDAMHTW